MNRGQAQVGNIHGGRRPRLGTPWRNRAVRPAGRHKPAAHARRSLRVDFDFDLAMWLSGYYPMSEFLKDLYNLTSDDVVIVITVLAYGALFATGLCWFWFEKE
jgi:hypothetical protein